MGDHGEGTHYRKGILSNGMRIVTEFIPHVHSVAVGCWIIGGSRIENEADSGIAHFIEHMLFKGTERRSARDIAIEIDSIGGHLDAFTSKEVTAVLANVLDEHLPLAIDLLTDLIFYPIFPEDELERERSVILEEIRMIEDMPDEYIDDMYLKKLWPDHPLGRSITGIASNIEKFSRTDIIDYYKKNFLPPKIVLVAVGNFEHERLKELIEKSCERLSFPHAQPYEFHVADSPPFTSHISAEARDLEQVHMCVGTLGLSQNHDKRYAGYLLTTILGGSISSRLFQRVREERGLAYSIYSFMTNYLDIGNLTVYAGTKKESVGEVIDLILQELKNIKAAFVDEKELERGKNQLKGNLMLSLESTVNRMSKLAKQEIYFKRHFPLEDILRFIDEVSLEDIHALANQIINSRYINLATLGPFDFEDFDQSRILELN
ncbi:MAG: M16 family metallopeptidase [bacterium]